MNDDTKNMLDNAKRTHIGARDVMWKVRDHGEIKRIVASIAKASGIDMSDFVREAIKRHAINLLENDTDFLTHNQKIKAGIIYRESQEKSLKLVVDVVSVEGSRKEEEIFLRKLSDQQCIDDGVSDNCTCDKCKPPHPNPVSDTEELPFS